MTGKKALLLLSGGIDSPVAGVLMKEKGFELEAVHFDYRPFTDDTALNKSKVLAEKIGVKTFFAVSFKHALKELSEKTERKYYFILSKRIMMKLAEKIAREKGFEMIVTGESVAQVSSQTVENLNAITKGVKMRIERPLIGLSKQEIIDLSLRYGLFEESKGKEFCDPFAIKKPVTKARIDDVLKEEEKLDLDEISRGSLKEIQEISLKAGEKA